MKSAFGITLYSVAEISVGVSIEAPANFKVIVLEVVVSTPPIFTMCTVASRVSPLAACGTVTVIPSALTPNFSAFALYVPSKVI